MTGSAPALVHDQALEIARGWSGPEAPASWGLTAALFSELAGDDELLRLAAAIPAERLPPLLFVASVCRLVATEPQSPLAAYFPGLRHSPAPLDADFTRAYRQFVHDRHDDLADVWSSHVYQMSEVARCTQLALALAAVAEARPTRAVALIDVGTGAGFGLYLDRYRYVVDGVEPFGDPDSPVLIECHRQGVGAPSATDLPAIEHRIGIDLAPIDLHDDEAIAWLRACLPPEEATLRRADEAVAVARAGDATILAGDADDQLAAAIDAVPDELLVCVIDAYTAVFFDDAKRTRMATLLQDRARRRDVVWISLDPLVPLGTAASAGVQGAVDLALIDENRRGGVFGVLSLWSFDGPTTVLATAHPSGTQMRWRRPS